jgi:hypothetical protein
VSEGAKRPTRIPQAGEAEGVEDPFGPGSRGGASWASAAPARCKGEPEGENAAGSGIIDRVQALAPNPGVTRPGSMLPFETNS